ncbi:MULTISPECIES: hypothetical protein [unclassified Cupriavidus]|uniref:hypothetical protein n=1 Tax=unclassified Cupriavidus TaxID=2640874 RepID=UPI0010F83E9D|nr:MULTISPECIES: hypothetical protein [unclassified Cupriavidus]MWL89100.1 hypothetical protein [Cupriavidus sp. SW-Y-13]
MTFRITFRTAIVVMSIALATPLAHATVGEDAREFKNNFKADVKEAGRKTGHAFAEAARAVGHGAKAAGHAVKDTTKRGYYATKQAIKGDSREGN